MKSDKILTYGVLVSGIILSLSGAAFVIAYILEAIVARTGEPDQSLLFWYLPILFIGLMGMTIGIGIIVWGAVRLRAARPQIPESDARSDI